VHSEERLEGEATSTRASGPLAGIKVLDIATVIAGPLCATLLADLGADVLKIEMPEKGDHIRYLPPHKDGVPLWSKVVNRNKRGITLDLRTPEGVAVFERLIATQDVLVENFRPGTLERWGLSSERLFALNPHLIILRVTGFGQTGPYSGRPGFARIFEGLSGFVNLCGSPDGPPMYAGYPVSDSLTGVFGAMAVAAALHHRDALPERPGQEIDLSATEAMFRILDFMVIEYDQLGVSRQRSGNLNAYSAPSDVYPTRDGKWIALAVSAPTVFERLAHALDHADWLTDARFSTNIARLANRAAIEGQVRDWFGARTASEAASILTAHDVSFSPIYDIRDICEDEHFKAREAVISVEDSHFGSVRMQNVVPRFSRTPGRVWRTGPALGEHNDEIYGEFLRMTREEIEALKKARVI
jgi:crotonobetainyl-CoA:carnitine CoA-transferase CaiB-like acyl-CoA transferase